MHTTGERVTKDQKRDRGVHQVGPNVSRNRDCFRSEGIGNAGPVRKLSDGKHRYSPLLVGCLWLVFGTIHLNLSNYESDTKQNHP
jgi:hypothetical protein